MSRRRWLLGASAVVVAVALIVLLTYLLDEVTMALTAGPRAGIMVEDVWLTDLAAARHLSVRANRPLLIYFYNELPEEETSAMLTNPAVNQVLKQHYVRLLFDTSRNRPMAAKLAVHTNEALRIYDPPCDETVVVEGSTTDTVLHQLKEHAGSFAALGPKCP